MPSRSPITEPPTHADWLARMECVVKGKSFRESDKPKDRISGRSLLAIVSKVHNLSTDTGSTQATAEELCGTYSVRVCRRVLAFLRGEGLLIEQTFRRDHSPRVERTLNWPQLRLWIEQQATTTNKVNHASQGQPVAHRQLQQDRGHSESRPHSRATERRSAVVPTVPPQKQPLVSPRFCDRDWMPQRETTSPQGLAAQQKLTALNVSPLAIDQAAVSLDTVERLIDHYASTGLPRADGTLCYAWSPGLLYKRITDEALAFRPPGDWPKSKDDEWRKLKAQSVNAARQARETTVRQQAPEIDKRARLHQLEMRFADLLKDPALIVERLLQLPNPSHYLIKHIRTNGINSDGMRLLALSTIVRHESTA